MIESIEILGQVAVLCFVVGFSLAVGMVLAFFLAENIKKPNT